MLVRPTAWFVHAVANESNEQSGETSQHKHGTPAIRVANKIVGEGRQKKAEIVAGMHEPRAHLPAFLGPFLRDECAAIDHSPPIPMPASRRKAAKTQTLVDKALSRVKTEKKMIVKLSVRTRPNRSAIGPQINDKPHPTRKSANSAAP